MARIRRSRRNSIRGRPRRNANMLHAREANLEATDGNQRRWANMQEDILQIITSRIDVLSRARLAGTCTVLLETVPRISLDMPLDLPCVLEEDLSWPIGLPQEGTRCTLMPLDAPALHARFMSTPDKRWVGANGDWLAYVGDAGHIELHNVYTTVTVPLPPISSIGFDLEDLPDSVQFHFDQARAKLNKIAIADAPSKKAGYSKYTVIAVFDISIAIARGGFTSDGWKLLRSDLMFPFVYEDAVLHGGRIFALTNEGSVFVWQLSYGLNLAPQEIPAPVIIDGQDLTPLSWNLVPDINDNQTMLLVHTRGVVTGEEVESPYLERGLRSYGTMRCLVFQLNGMVWNLAGAHWERKHDLGAYSLFIGMNYPLMIELAPSVHDAQDLPFMKHGCICSMHERIRSWNGDFPDLCRFSLNEDLALGVELTSNQARARCPPIWLVPSMRNAEDWNVH
ncbi:hypothetical protein VPH35_140628 [Triticum aestivum]